MGNNRSQLRNLFSLVVRAAAHRFTIPLLLAVAIGLISLVNHFQGVDWGDDFALYMRQAKAIAIGNIGEVLSDNRFTVDNSGWHSFSPYIYPWGWPLIVSPFYALLGLNYEVVKFLQVIALCTFLACFYSLTRPRVGTRGATATERFRLGVDCFHSTESPPGPSDGTLSVDN